MKHDQHRKGMNNESVIFISMPACQLLVDVYLPVALDFHHASLWLGALHRAADHLASHTTRLFWGGATAPLHILPILFSGCLEPRRVGQANLTARPRPRNAPREHLGIAKRPNHLSAICLPRRDVIFGLNVISANPVLSRVRQNSTPFYWIGYVLPKELNEDEIPPPPLRKGEKARLTLRTCTNRPILFRCDGRRMT